MRERYRALPRLIRMSFLLILFCLLILLGDLAFEVMLHAWLAAAGVAFNLLTVIAVLVFLVHLFSKDKP